MTTPCLKSRRAAFFCFLRAFVPPRTHPFSHGVGGGGDGGHDGCGHVLVWRVRRGRNGGGGEVVVTAKVEMAEEVTAEAAMVAEARAVCMVETGWPGV